MVRPPVPSRSRRALASSGACELSCGSPPAIPVTTVPILNDHVLSFFEGHR